MSHFRFRGAAGTGGSSKSVMAAFSLALTELEMQMILISVRCKGNLLSEDFDNTQITQ